MTRARRRIAVIGSGISGLAAAWLLSRHYKVTLLEQDARAGGHSNTVDAPDAHGSVPVDTGFIVYNTACYPNLVALFDHLSVPTARSDMSFAVSLEHGAYEYSGTGLGGIFGQPSNLLRPSHIGMLLEIRRFFRAAPALIEQDPASSPTLAAYLAANSYSDAFVTRHILPMAAAIWSAPPAKLMGFPAVSFARFFANHGLLRIKNRPEWRTVVGGSRAYVARMLSDFPGDVCLGRGVHAVHRNADGVTITDANGRSETFDACVLACHADQSLGLLADADRPERQLLGAFAYQQNRAYLHTDVDAMPRRRRVWSSWNYIGGNATSDMRRASPSVTYWMNRLQPLETKRDIFVTLNPTRSLAAGAVLGTFDYAHPVFDQVAIAAQGSLWSLQGRRNTWFCGSYFGYGFHEDGLQSGLAVAEAIGGVRRPWTVENESGRIAITPTAAPFDMREAAE